MGRNYPAEWTRLVGLTLDDAQLLLATGDAMGAAVLVRVHEQLAKLLDGKAKASALGSVLLGRGRRALTMAGKAWREPTQKKTALAEDVESALNAWGDVPPARFPAFDAARLAGVFGKAGKTFAAHGDGLERVADLLALPVPAEALLAAGAFADEAGRLAAVQLAYRSGIDRRYPTPADLGVWMEERGLLAAKDEKGAAMTRQAFVTRAWAAEVARTDRTPLFGAVVTLSATKGVPARGPRDAAGFGPVHFGLPFSLGREGLSPMLTDKALNLADKALIARLTTGLDVPPPRRRRRRARRGA
jgi:hypothetical protein